MDVLDECPSFVAPETIDGHNMSFAIAREARSWEVVTTDHDYTPPMVGEMLVPADAPEAVIIARFVELGAPAYFDDVITLYTAIFEAADQLA